MSDYRDDQAMGLVAWACYKVVVSTGVCDSVQIYFESGPYWWVDGPYGIESQMRFEVFERTSEAQEWTRVHSSS